MSAIEKGPGALEIAGQARPTGRGRGAAPDRGARADRLAQRLQRLGIAVLFQQIVVDGAEPGGGAFLVAHLDQRARGERTRVEIGRVQRAEPHDDLGGAGLVAAIAAPRRDGVQLRLGVGQEALLLGDVGEVQLDASSSGVSLRSFL